jgi:hypothetical protein
MTNVTLLSPEADPEEFSRGAVKGWGLGRGGVWEGTCPLPKKLNFSLEMMRFGAL